MNRFLLSCIFILGLASLALAQSTRDFIKTLEIDNVIESNQQYTYVMPAQQIFQGAVSRTSTSPSSRYIAFLADPLANRKIPFIPTKHGDLGPSQGIYVYDRTAKASHRVAFIPEPQFSLASLEWLPDSDLLLYTVQNENGPATTLYNPIGRQAVAIPSNVQGPGYNQARYVESAHSLVFLRASVAVGENSSVLVFDTRSQQIRTFQLPGPAYESRSNRPGYYVRVYDYPAKNFRICHVNLANGGLTETENWPDEPFTNDASLWVNNSAPFIALRGRDSEGLPPSPKDKNPMTQPVILTTLGLAGGITLDEKAAWYTDRSGLYLCDLVPVDLGQLEDLAREFAKHAAMTRAKQVGIGLIIYAADYDDHFPRSSDWSEVIQPYIKNRETINGFTFLLNGDSNGGKSDVTTPLGQVETPFGTATVHIDGSVTWKDRPKPAQARKLSEIRT